jgi:hypothetical protein
VWIIPAYIVALIIWVFGWQIMLHGAHEMDRKFKHFYADMAEGRESERPESKESTPKDYWPMVIGKAWFWGQVTMTVFFLILSIIILVLSKGPNKPALEGDVIHVSGKNLETIINLMAKTHKNVMDKGFDANPQSR